MEIKKVGVVGCGQMGSGITQVCAQAGYQVIVSEISSELLNKGLASISSRLTRDVEKGRLSEQDKDSDKLVVKYTGKPVKEIAKTILNIILKIKSISTLKPPPQPGQSFQFTPHRLFSQVRLRNRINSILKTDPDKIYSRIFPKILMFILFLIFLSVQLMIAINTNNFYIYLR